MRLKIVILSILFVFALALNGCQNEGPAEKTGKKIDDTVEKVGNAVEDAGKKIQEAAEKE